MLKLPVRWLLYAVLLLYAAQATAQLSPLQHFTTDDGLPSNTIYSITKDRHGYLWLASDKGISRFNGVRFQNFSTFDGMPDNEVFAVIPDFEDRLWMTTFNGMLCYMQDNVFHTERNTPWLHLPFKSSQLRAHLQPDSSINIIFSDPGKFVNLRGNHVRIIEMPVQQKSKLVCISSLPGDGFRLHYADRHIDVDARGKQIAGTLYPPGTPYQPIEIKSDGSFLILTNDGIYDQQFHKLFNLRKTKINATYPIGVKVTGRNCFAGQLNGFTINDSIFVSLGEHVNSIETDNKDNIWIATRGNGIFRMSKFFKEITEYSKQYENQVLYARSLGDRLFYVNNKGSLFEFHNGVNRLLNQNLSEYQKNTVYFTKTNFRIDDRGNFLQYYGDQTVFITGLTSGKLVTRRLKANLDDNIKEILFCGNYVYYVSFINMIGQCAYADLFKPGPLPHKEIDVLPSNKYSRIFARNVNPADSSLWVSMTEGLFRVKDSLVTRKTQFPKIIFRQFAFFGPYLAGITEGNHFVVCSNYNGKVRIDTVGASDCIWENIYSIDRSHCLVSTNSLYRVLSFFPPTAQGRSKYAVQTIENNFIPRQAEFVATDSLHCYFFKKGTITKVATRILFDATTAPGPIFLSLKTSGKNHPIRPEITITYNEARNISLLFDNVSFSGREAATEYSISEQPDSENWRPITGNEINLNQPGYGHFTIKVRSRTPGSAYSQPVTLQLTILKPFWATWWFILLSVFVFIVLFYLTLVLLTRRRLHKKQKEHDSEMKYQQAEYKALNALMNPHFIFNSLNNIQGLINKNDKRVANAYLVIFSDLIRQNMQNISKGFISLQAEINLVENYLNLEKLRFKEFINYEIIMDEEVEAELILIPPLMIQPLVENAVKHGLLPKQSELNKVTIHIQEKDDLLYIEIEDNGVGLTYASEHRSNLHESFGLSNLQKRADYLKKIQKQKIELDIKELKDEAGNILGTRATIVMELDEQNSESGIR